MQGLIPTLSDIENMQIGDELTRLFALQDMALGKEKKAIFVAELSATGMPVGAIVQGIRSMVAHDLKNIKFNHIVDASRSFVYTDVPSEKCAECLSGYIVMRDEHGRNLSLACSCPMGQMKRSQGLTPWNGENVQLAKGRTLTRQERGDSK